VPLRRKSPVRLFYEGFKLILRRKSQGVDVILYKQERSACRRLINQAIRTHAGRGVICGDVLGILVIGSMANRKQASIMQVGVN
jgi:hypothetical protein